MSKMSVLGGELGALSKNIETKMKSFASIFLLVGDLELSMGFCLTFKILLCRTAVFLLRFERAFSANATGRTSGVATGISACNHCISGSCILDHQNCMRCKAQ